MTAKNQIYYEWCIESVVRETGDIEDLNFVDSFAAALLGRQTEKAPLLLNDYEYDYDIVLVRNEGNDAEGVTGRLWAYVEGGVLPEFFANASGNATTVKVPKKYHTELEK